MQYCHSCQSPMHEHEMYCPRCGAPPPMQSEAPPPQYGATPGQYGGPPPQYPAPPAPGYGAPPPQGPPPGAYRQAPGYGPQAPSQGSSQALIIGSVIAVIAVVVVIVMAMVLTSGIGGNDDDNDDDTPGDYETTVETLNLSGTLEVNDRSHRTNLSLEHRGGNTIVWSDHEVRCGNDIFTNNPTDSDGHTVTQSQTGDMVYFACSHGDYTAGEEYNVKVIDIDSDNIVWEKDIRAREGW